MSMEVLPWARTEYYKVDPSVNELIRLHHLYYRRDLFAQVMYAYPFGKDTIANVIKALLPRTDYEFFLARLTPSKEIAGWIALSFNIEGVKAENKVEYEAKLEWTEMYSHIMRDWKVDNAGEKSNVWDTIKRASSSLQAKNLPHDYCIINTLVMIPEMYKSGVAHKLVECAIRFWRNRVTVGTEWAMWVQAPPFAQKLYKGFGFEELGEYTVDLGDYGFLPWEERPIHGEYGWKFMVLRGTSDVATKEPVAAWKSKRRKHKEQQLEDAEEDIAAKRPDKGKMKHQPLEDEEEHAAARKFGKGKGRDHRPDDQQQDEDSHAAHEGLAERDTKRKRAWEEAEKRLEDIRLRRGLPPLPGEVATLTRIQRKAEDRGLITTGLSKDEGVGQRTGDVKPAPPREPLEGPLQRNAEVTEQSPNNFVPTESEENLIDAMRAGGVDEEEIDLAKAIALSLTDAVAGG
ncbi:MAG: hypothetical protein Q9161_003638 [Pseudevernia consocians]